MLPNDCCVDDKSSLIGSNPYDVKHVLYILLYIYDRNLMSDSPYMHKHF
ncbi:hypothetical protein MtrunA17_Chr1g0167571 [Medicago truncatula]|uniref:Uncharacterized protein n=1 Tax=Medicago truncatula TaxID=3880 RepID=A0A396JQU5_MEDTR|nr:hypothetical protein MtrunA17_Chr1g0167571 [Medicago truncatula]